MPRRKKTVPENANDWRDKMHYINLSYNDELEVKEWLIAQKAEPSSMLDELLDDLWSVKLTNRQDGRGVTTSVTCRDPESELLDHTYIMTYPSYKVGLMVSYWLVRVRLSDERASADLSTSVSSTFDDLI